jgi:hypothetical protein
MSLFTQLLVVTTLLVAVNLPPSTHGFFFNLLTKLNGSPLNSQDWGPNKDSEQIRSSSSKNAAEVPQDFLELGKTAPSKQQQASNVSEIASSKPFGDSGDVLLLQRLASWLISKGDSLLKTGQKQNESEKVE